MSILSTMTDFGFASVYNLLKGDTVNWVCKKERTDEEYLFVRNGTKRFGGTIKVWVNGYVDGHSRILDPEIYQDSGYETTRMIDMWYFLNRGEVTALTLQEVVLVSRRMQDYGRMRSSFLFNELMFRGEHPNYTKIGDLYYNKANLFTFTYYKDGENFSETFVTATKYEQYANTKFREGYRRYGDIWYNAHEVTWYNEIPLPYWIEQGEICPTCGEAYLIPFNRYHGHGECANCHEDVILPYSTRAETKFDFKVGKDKFAFLGVELEVSCGSYGREEPARVVKKLLKDHCILKSDGSVNNGFEIVSAPAHIDVHKENFSKFFDSLPEELCEDDSCGMHVHIDRNSLSVTQISRMAEFMNNNTKFIEKIAGRKLNTYCKDNNGFNKSGAFKSKATGSDRYAAINLCPKRTVEVRIFASTLDKSTFERNLEFVKALVKFSRPGELEVSVKETLTHNHFLKWMAGQPRSEYPALKPFIIKNFSK